MKGVRDDTVMRHVLAEQLQVVDAFRREIAIQDPVDEPPIELHIIFEHKKLLRIRF